MKNAMGYVRMQVSSQWHEVYKRAERTSSPILARRINWIPLRKKE